MIVKAELTVDIQHEYEQRFRDCALSPAFKGDADQIITHMLRGRAQYIAVANDTGVPWYFIGLIHQRECDGNFDCHLHNGNPLTARTVDEPKGRPVAGQPPFTWHDSAVDALRYEGLTAWKNWTTAGLLFRLELYNGWGYRSHDVASPYLWSGSQFYRRGKYGSDGHFDAHLVDKQVGAALVLRRMIAQGVVHLDSSGRDLNAAIIPAPAPATTGVPK
jgi:lysozyme family protein